jgi:hypothetical protein
MLAAFSGALLADAVGLGKTYVALALATRYRRAAVIAPATLIPQWLRVAQRLDLRIAIQSDQSLSRGRPVPAVDLLIVDEAHRFRNPGTKRYHALACRPAAGHLLLVTATPVVNRAADLTSLLALFLPDHGLAVLGLSSLRGARQSRNYGAIAHAAAAVMVARSHAVLSDTTAIPAVTDAAVLSPSPIEPETLSRVVSLLDELQFPTFHDRTAASLLALHLRYRLASSAAASLDTLRRHRSYLDRAIAAAARGERLTRQDARRLFGTEDESQLSLELGPEHWSPPLDPAELIRERKRIDDIVGLLRSCRGPNPKPTRLREIVAAREPHKTIVFTAAIATARELAQCLGWRRIGVVSGRGARIASGPLPVERVLSLFAPVSRGGPDPEPSAQVTTLLATDLASEGLDLQDADTIIHYDLPWTPFRLEQRLGRIARLGSLHRHVDVWWFVPPPELEARLALSRRIAGKASEQFALGVPVSSRVGQARVLGQLFAWRERFPWDGTPHRLGKPLYCVVRGPRATAFAVSWCRGDRAIPEIIVLEHGATVIDERRRRWLVEQLCSAPPAHGTPVTEDLEFLYRLTRERLRLADRGPRDDQTARLSRQIARHASAAARSRDENLLSLLDQAFDRLNGGLTEGGQRTLQRLLSGRPRAPSLAGWLRDHSLMRGGMPFARLEGAIFGVGLQ